MPRLCDAGHKATVAVMRLKKKTTLNPIMGICRGRTGYLQLRGSEQVSSVLLLERFREGLVSGEEGDAV